MTGRDVWEVVVALRHTDKRGDARVGAAAERAEHAARERERFLAS